MAKSNKRETLKDQKGDPIYLGVRNVSPVPKSKTYQLHRPEATRVESARRNKRKIKTLYVKNKSGSFSKRKGVPSATVGFTITTEEGADFIQALSQFLRRSNEAGEAGLLDVTIHRFRERKSHGDILVTLTYIAPEVVEDTVSNGKMDKI